MFPTFDNLWLKLPQVTSIPYSSANNAGNIPLTISNVVTTPRVKDEWIPQGATSSNGVAVRWLTTFKIDPTIWAGNTNGIYISGSYDGYDLTGLYILVSGNPATTGVWTRIDGAYTFQLANWAQGTIITENIDGGTVWNYGGFLNDFGWTATNNNFNTGDNGGNLDFTSPSSFAALYPKSRDQLTVDGITWTVYKTVDQSHLNNLYRLEAAYIELVTELADQVDWKPVVNLIDDIFVDRTASNPTVKGHYYCRIQPITAEIADRLGKREMHNHFIISMNEQPNISFGDIFVDQNGIIYKVKSWTSREDLVCLFEVFVELQEVLN